MQDLIQQFWTWFQKYSDQFTEDCPVELFDEILDQLQLIDDRVYYEMCRNTPVKELILTASGDIDVFPIVEAIIDAAPEIDGWICIAFKQAQGFKFTFENNDLKIKADELWFMPLSSSKDPNSLGIRLAVPNAEAIFEYQTVDTAYTILETGIGEQSSTLDINYLEVGDLPENPESEGYIELPELARYIEWHKSKNAVS